MDIIKRFINENKMMSMLIGGILGIILLLVIIFGIAGCVGGRKITYEELEIKMIEATHNYYKDNEAELPKEEGSEVSITLEMLIEREYLKPLEDLVEGSCSGNVVLKNNGGRYATYPTLTCGTEYSTSKLYPILISNIVTSGDGLYEYENEYVYRGEYVNNTVSFGNTLWRVVSINKQGNIRLVKADSESRVYRFDDRYNNESQKSTGISVFATSRLRESLDTYYTVIEKGFTEDDLGHLIAHDVCVSARSRDNLAIDKNVDCSEVYKNQHISVPYVSEYFRASIDPNCTAIDKDICTNYNYFSNEVGNVLTANRNTANTYEVYTTNYTPVEARLSSTISLVVELDQKEVFSGGSGTKADPYVLVIK